MLYVHMTTGYLSLRIINFKGHGTEVSWPNINYTRDSMTMHLKLFQQQPLLQSV
jgi:hypothetical protein